MTQNDDIELIKKSIREYAHSTESIEVTDTTDSAGNQCLEWRTVIILEMFGAKARHGKEERLSRQQVPVQFDVSFDKPQKHILVFIQWGRIEPSIWFDSEQEVRAELAKEGNIILRYHEDREVMELCVVYPFHEFDFAFVYEEIVSIFGMINGYLFRKSNNV
jgi:hypothetical protein